jgi:hypothetical protein
MRSLVIAACAVAGFLSLPLAAQGSGQAGSSFALGGQAPASDAILSAKSGSTLLELKGRPLVAAELSAAIPSETAALFGAKPDVPFDNGRVLYGWPERPGLYCDLLRNRGLGLSTACLLDVDGDARFDEGRRYDFNSALGDLLGITPSGKIIGVRTTGKATVVPLAQPVAFGPAKVPADVTGRLALKWRKIKLGDAPAAQLWITTPDNYTGTEGLSEQVVQLPFDRAPQEVEFYGVRLRVLGFDEKGAMRYQVLGVEDGATVPLRFRGYTFRILMI